MTNSINRRVSALCLMALTLVWVAFCWPWFFDGKIIPYDAKNHFYPMIRFVAQAWHSGESFLWSPHHYGGFPMVSDPQSAIWTPSFWIPTLLSAEPSMQLVDTLHLAHLLVGGFAIFAFGRVSGWHHGASLIAALIYMMAGPSSLRLEHMLMTVSYMWLAVALWRLKAAMEYGGLWRGLIFGLTLALILIDRNHVAYLGAWFLFLYWLSAILGGDASGRWSRQGAILLGGAVSLLLVAVPVILLLQLAGDSNRPEFSYEQASWQSLHPVMLLSFILPEYFGSLRLGGGANWGPPSNIWGEQGLKIHRGMMHMYSGVLPLILILWIGVIKRQLFTKEARFFSLACLVCLFYALGRYTPVFEVFYNNIPGVDLFRRPADALFIFGFSLSLLSGVLVQKVLRRFPPGSSVPRMLITGIGVLALLVFMLVLADSRERVVDYMQALIVPGALAVVMVIVVLRVMYRQERRAGALVVLALLVAGDLVYHSSNTRINARDAAAYQVLETPEDNPIYARLIGLLSEKDPVGVAWRTEIIGMGPVVQNLPQVIRSQALLGYNPLRLDAFETHIAPNMQNNAAKRRGFGDRMTSYASDTTNALGLKYIVSGAPLDKIDPNLTGDQFKLLGTSEDDGRKAYFYENTKALPRAVLQSETGEGIGGAVTVTRYANTEIVLAVDSTKAGTLVLREFDYPGWEATVNGVSIEITRHEDMFRAVPVPAGASKVVFRFDPLSLDNLRNAARMLTH